MRHSFRRWGRTVLFGAVFTGGVLTALSSPEAAMALQEPTCYLMVCEGRVCVATQIPCPDDG